MTNIFLFILLLSPFWGDAQRYSTNTPSNKLNTQCTGMEVFSFSDTLGNAYTLFTGESAAAVKGLNLGADTNVPCTDAFQQLISQFQQRLRRDSFLRGEFSKVKLISVQLDSFHFPAIYKQIVEEANNSPNWTGRSNLDGQNPLSDASKQKNNALKILFTDFKVIKELKSLFKEVRTPEVQFEFIPLDDFSLVRRETLSAFVSSPFFSARIS